MGQSNAISSAQDLDERQRSLAVRVGTLGLLVTLSVYVTAFLTGELTLVSTVEALAYGSVLLAITASGYRNYEVRFTLVSGLVLLYAAFWIVTLVELRLGQVKMSILPLALFIPLFLVITLPYRVLFCLVPVQFVSVLALFQMYGPVIFGDTLYNGMFRPAGLFFAGLSALSFCLLAVVAYAREKTDNSLLEVIAEKDRLASTDSLTKLMNRRAFVETLERLWHNEERLVIAFIDLDHFKPLNDQFGHAAGDTVLWKIGDRLKSASIVRAAARLGGDEFAIVLDPGSCNANADEQLKDLHLKLTSPIDWDGCTLSTGASIGYAEAHVDATNTTCLLRAADTAMRRVKSNGDGWARFCASIDGAAIESASLEVELRSAISAGQIRAAIQPIANATSREVVGYELLSRWTNSGFERDPAPNEFIPIAEKLGLLNDVLWATLDEALSKLDLQNKCLAINVSPAQLLASDFIGCLMTVLKRHAVHPSRITLEVTEQVAFRNVEKNVDILEKARAFGMQVALDDFGTGYSSLSMIDVLPLDKLKIDQAFVRRAGESDRTDSILSAAIRLAKQLNLTCCVEGIETEDAANRVKNLGADEVQGYWLGAPYLLPKLHDDLKIAS